MCKVLIADDEKKVCQLLHMLVDWEELGMEVIGMVHNGCDALEMIKEKRPDIVITDIRMPGMSGLEMIEEVKKDSQLHAKFVIISGYKEFQYAQAAVRYGVNDYLLKPIRKEELLATLTKIQAQLKKQSEKFSNEEQLRKSLENNRRKLRRGIFTDILFQGGTNRQKLTLEKVNEEYGYEFKEGNFQILAIRLDHAESIYGRNTEVLEEKSMNLILQELGEYCNEIGIIYQNGVIYAVINYEKEGSVLVKKGIKSLLADAFLQDAIYQQMDVTIGVGGMKEDISGLPESLHDAECAYQERILSGAGKIYEYSGEESSLADSEIFQEFNNSFLFATTNLNVEQMQKALDYLKRGLSERKDTTGHEVLQMTKEVCNLYLMCLRSNNIFVEKADTFMQTFNEYADDCNSFPELFSHLSKTILDSVMQIIDDQKQEITKPIRMAKQMMENEYMNPITVEDVSAKVGFSASHFSTMFKKETGVTFLEYLSGVRMRKAKEMLKESNKNIATICEEVGYSDVKYFTKSFRKHTGLKPNEYRKLYS